MPLEKNIDKPVMTLGLHQVRTPCANGMANQSFSGTQRMASLGE